jgi:hypothetical protein
MFEEKCIKSNLNMILLFQASYGKQFSKAIWANISWSNLGSQDRPTQRASKLDLAKPCDGCHMLAGAPTLSTFFCNSRWLCVKIPLICGFLFFIVGFYYLKGLSTITPGLRITEMHTTATHKVHEV